jgi:hypothetical protein
LLLTSQCAALAIVDTTRAVAKRHEHISKPDLHTQQYVYGLPKWQATIAVPVEIIGGNQMPFDTDTRTKALL